MKLNPVFLGGAGKAEPEVVDLVARVEAGCFLLDLGKSYGRQDAAPYVEILDPAIGAFEIAIRYSRLNLNDLNIRGGEQRNTSIALNWYGPGNQLRVQSSLIHYATDEIAGNEDDYVAQIRCQIHW